MILVLKFYNKVMIWLISEWTISSIMTFISTISIFFFFAYVKLGGPFHYGYDW